MGRCCVAGCKSLIFILNMVVLLIGLAIMAISGYLIYQQFEYKVWSQAGAYGYVFIPLAIGFIIAMMACCSSSAAMRERKCPMVFFASLQLIFGICIVAVGAGSLILNNSASRVATTSPGKLADTGDEWNLETYVSDFEVGMYDKCCRSSDSPSLKPTLCSTDATMGCIYSSVNDGYAQGHGVDEEFCSAVTDSDQLNWCSGEETSYNGLGTFQIQVASFLDTVLFGSGIAFAVFGTLLLVAFIGSCYIICCNRRVHVTEQKPSNTVAQV